ncbi:MAG: Re/Si-specific NAD(P)(+) transhydrogenase subunit alpha [Bacteroidota bacterium]
MIIGIPAAQGSESRVAASPSHIKLMQKMGIEQFLLEKGAGTSAHFQDSEYADLGVKVVDRTEVLKSADVLLLINPLEKSETASLRTEQVLLGQLNPLGDPAALNDLTQAGVTSFSLDQIPRTTRAQSMDILSSMATTAGYRAVLLAASHLPKFFPMFMTAAGTIKPSKVLILGAGVAGLQAISSARRLGAVVEAFDVRAAVKEEVLSLGAKFVEVEGATDDKAAGGYAVEQTEDYKQRQAELIHQHAMQADVVICTAQIPGRKAPVLIPEKTVAGMKAGSVIVDLAASTGGNCELTENDAIVVKKGVTIIGDSNLPTGLATDASEMFGKNLCNFLKLIVEEGQLNLNFEDDLVAGSCITKEGKVVNARVKKILGLEEGA